MKYFTFCIVFYLFLRINIFINIKATNIVLNKYVFLVCIDFFFLCKLEFHIRTDLTQAQLLLYIKNVSLIYSNNFDLRNIR